MRISVDAVWGLWCGALWVLSGWGSLNDLKNNFNSVGSLFKHRRITLGKMNFAGKIIGINTDFNISSSRNSDKSHAILKMCDY